MPRACKRARRKNAAAFRIGGELDFIDGEKIHLAFQRHRLDGRNPIARAPGNDFFLAGDERHFARVFLLDDPVINLAREQAQRQPDHSGPMRQHAFQGVMGLPCIGGTEHRRHASAARGRKTIERKGGGQGAA